MANHYVAIMLRLWSLGEAETLLWRASLEDPHTGQVMAFSGFDEMVAYLRAHIEELSRTDHSATDHGRTDPEGGQ